MIKNIDSINITGKNVLIRADFNVPIEDGIILSDFRLKAVLKTINFCLEKNAKVILMSHLGRPNGVELKLSLYPVFEYLRIKFPLNKVFFSDDCISDESIKKTNSMKNGEIHLLENLRFHNDELLNCEDFAFKLSNHGDVYINEAFGTSHRMHSSNSAILKFFDNKGIGFLMDRELRYLKNINLGNTNLAILVGGAKISTKIGMIRHFIGKANTIMIGGAMSFTFLKALNYNIGKSLVEDNMLDEARDILKLANKSNTEILLPLDIVCAKKISNNAKSICKSITKISNDDVGLDIGKKTIKKFIDILNHSSTLIWNGPMGVFEIDSFKIGTSFLANSIGELTESKNLVSVIGGGDTASAVINLSLENLFTHVSTGGGASLKLLSGMELELFKSWRKK